MRRREYHWSLYHSTEKNQLDNLRTDQVEIVFAAIPDREHGRWFIWKEGLDSWRPFDDFPELLQSLRKADTRVFEAPPPLPDSVEAQELNTEPDEAALAAPSPSPALGPEPADANEITKTGMNTVSIGAPALEPVSAVVKPSARSEKAARQETGPTSPLVINDETDGPSELSLMRAGVLEEPR